MYKGQKNFNPPFDLRFNLRFDLRFNLRFDPKIEPRFDPRFHSRFDPQFDFRFDPRIDPHFDHQFDPRFDFYFRYQLPPSPTRPAPVLERGSRTTRLSPSAGPRVSISEGDVTDESSRPPNGVQQQGPPEKMPRHHRYQ